MKIFLAHASSFDFRTKLYEPIRASALNDKHEFILPQEHGKEVVTKETIRSCGLFIIDASLPSTGAGVELGWADAFNVPAIIIHEKGSAPSVALLHLTESFIEYDDPDDLIEKLGTALKALT